MSYYFNLLALFSIFLTLFVWFFYPLLVILVSKFFCTKNTIDTTNKINKVSILIPALNEESTIIQRLNNIFESDTDIDYEILIGCDGSTDHTAKNALSVSDSRIKVFEYDKNRGRATIHNKLVKHADGDILIFTDAATSFHKDFLQKITAPFSDKTIGVVVGRIEYVNTNITEVTTTATKYWNLEHRLRTAESCLRILTTGTGAGMAMRKSAYSQLKPSEDIDYAGVIDAAFNGWTIISEQNAKFTDIISETTSAAFNTRIRQTSKSFKSIIRKVRQYKSIKNAKLILSILTHKTGRHLTPLFIIISVLSSLLSIDYDSSKAILILTTMILIFAATGWLLNKFNIKVMIFNIILVFTVINLARLFGVFISIFGKEYEGYSTKIR